MLFHHRPRLPYEREYFQSIISGSSAGIATTTAILIGLAINTKDLGLLATSVTVIVFIQAFNAAGSRFSDLRTAQEIDGEEHLKPRLPLLTAMIQFAFHIGAGLLTLVPLIVSDVETGLPYTVSLAIFTLTLIAAYKVKYVKNHALSDAVEFVLTGVLVMLVGLGAGMLLEFIG